MGCGSRVGPGGTVGVEARSGAVGGLGVVFAPSVPLTASGGWGAGRGTLFIGAPADLERRTVRIPVVDGGREPRPERT